MINGKFFFDKMGDKIVEKFPDPVQANAMFEIAQKLVDEGKDKKEIKKILKDLYGASKEELERLEEKFFKNKVNAEVHPDAIITELKAIEEEMLDYENQDSHENEQHPGFSSNGRIRLHKLIKELEGDKGKRQEASAEKKSETEARSREDVLKLLGEGKSVFGVVESEDNETGEQMFLVAEISDAEEYDKNGYWDIVQTLDTIEEAKHMAEDLAKEKNGVYIGVH